MRRGGEAVRYHSSMFSRTAHNTLARRSIATLAALLAFSLSCDSSTDPGDDPVASLSLSTISASQSSIVADGKTVAQITVTLKDAAGASLGKSGGAVTLTTTRGTVGAATDQN